MVQQVGFAGPFERVTVRLDDPNLQPLQVLLNPKRCGRCRLRPTRRCGSACRITICCLRIVCRVVSDQSPVQYIMENRFMSAMSSSAATPIVSEMSSQSSMSELSPVQLQRLMAKVAAISAMAKVDYVPDLPQDPI